VAPVTGNGRRPRRRGASRPARPISPDPELDARPPLPDPRGVRVSLAGGSAVDGHPPLVVEPPPIPLDLAPTTISRGVLGGIAPLAHHPADQADDPRAGALVDGRPSDGELVQLDEQRALLVRHAGDSEPARLLLLPPSIPSGPARGVIRREIVVDGWRIEVELEPAARAALRGPTEVHAIIPGVVVAVSVTPGDEVVAGQQLMAVEAMKMQNELLAPRDGVIERVAVSTGSTIEVGDLLLVLA
jgi:biotin carboxyl carrier protein